MCRMGVSELTRVSSSPYELDRWRSVVRISPSDCEWYRIIITVGVPARAVVGHVIWPINITPPTTIVVEEILFTQVVVVSIVNSRRIIIWLPSRCRERRSELFLDVIVIFPRLWKGVEIEKNACSVSGVKLIFYETHARLHIHPHREWLQDVVVIIIIFYVILLLIL